jgi:hypothetical protein
VCFEATVQLVGVQHEKYETGSIMIDMPKPQSAKGNMMIFKDGNLFKMNVDCITESIAVKRLN